MRDRRGFVLIFVLLTVVSLAGLVAILRLRALEEGRLARLPRLQQELRLSLPALARWCWEQALNSTSQQAPVLESENQTLSLDCSVEGFEVQATFSREETRLNLNQAREEELLRLFEQEGIAPERARVMAASLLDWIDPDPEHRVSGAEASFYEPLGYEPRNAALTRLDEVVFVRGFDPYLFWLDPGLYQVVTIYTRQGRPEEGPEGPWRLDQPGIYREELEIKHQGRHWRYLEILESPGPGRPPRVLFRRLLPIR